MKLSLNQIGRTIGDARLDYLSFYAPSWAQPAQLDRTRADLELAWQSASKPSRATAAPVQSARRGRPLAHFLHIHHAA